MTVPDTVMVMAAGLGRRMLPLTENKPKPLVELDGKPLIDHCLEKVAEAGISRAVINVHYLADLLEAHLALHDHSLQITISDERALLMETGGGLMQAKPLIDADPFFCVNSDNLWTDKGENTFVRLAKGWNDAKMDFLLLLIPTEKAHNHAGRGDFNLDEEGRITRHRPEQEWAPYVYTGIQLISKRALVDAPEGPFSTMLFWERAIAAGRCFGLVHDGMWFDVGSPSAIPTTEAVLANA